MNANSLKPFDDKKYVSEAEALKWVESLPKPEKDSSGSDTPPEVKPDVPETESASQDDNPVVDLEGRLIDLNPADKGNIKTQDGWVVYFNDKNELMVSMPDLYLAGKLGNQKLFESLRKDFEEKWIITSTRIIYENNQDARIIHNYGSKLIQTIEHKVVIPEYRPKLLADVLDTKEGLRYLQVLFGTNDNAHQIKDTLQKLSDYSLDKTKVWSAALLARSVERASGLGYDYGGFHVSGNINIDDNGRSRGVCVTQKI